MKFKHADIPAALALVREQLEEEGKRLSPRARRR